MIEVRFDVDRMEKIRNNVLHSIATIAVLRAAGMPIRERLLMLGVERGRVLSYNEDDLDGATWVVQWFDSNENPSVVVKWPVHSSGRGDGYSWVRYVNQNGEHDDPALVEDDEEL